MVIRLIIFILLLVSPAFAEDMLNNGGIFNKGQYVCDGSGNNCVKAKQINNVAGITDNGDGSVQFLSGTGNVGIGTPNYISQYVGVSTLAPSNIINVAGNIGISSSNPGDKLQVNGSFSLYIPGSMPTGGTITTNGTNTVHTFTSNGTFTPVSNGTITILGIGGGGSGGRAGGGGGGAGEYIEGTYSVTAGTPYAVVIGDGGVGNGAGSFGGNGGNTTFGGVITALGGGGGGNANNAQTGGSGGGAGSNANGTGAAATTSSNPGGITSYAFAGGNSVSSSPYPAGGGGGAGAVGTNGSGTAGGAGGAGKNSSITGSSVCYAGGGGGAMGITSGTPGSATCGGGAGKATPGAGNNGTDGLGAGGGGTEDGTAGGNGGKGIFIISYVTTSQSSTAIIRGTTDAKLGIGVFSPINKLDVSGGSVIGGSYAGTNIAPSNGLLVQGNVGIGSSVPRQKLEVVGQGNFNDGSQGMIIGAYTSGGGFGSLYPTTVTPSGTNYSLAISSGTSILNAASSLQFAISGNQKAIIDSNGNVGIGTSIPTQKLEAAGDIWLSGGTGQIIYARGGSGQQRKMISYVSATEETRLSANGSDYVYLRSTGNVGIGSSAPQAGLSVKGGGTGYVNIGQYTADTTYGAIALSGGLVASEYNFSAGHAGQSDQNDLYVSRKSGGKIHFKEANGTDQMIIDTGGNVGIGSTVPDQALYVMGNNAGAFAGMRVKNSNTTSGTTAGIKFSVTTSDFDGVEIGGGRTPNNHFYINTNGSERFRAEGNGNIGIGTLSPLALVEVTNPSAFDSFRVNDQSTDTTPFVIDSVGNTGIGTLVPKARLEVFGATSATAGLKVSSGMTNNPRFDLYDDGTYGIIKANADAGSNNFGLELDGEVIRFQTYNAGFQERMRIDTAGNVGINTTTAEAKLVVTTAASASAVTALKLTNPNGQVNGTGTVIQMGVASNFADGSSKITSTQLTGNMTSLQLQSHNNSTGVFNTGILIDGAGNVGIGTSVPAFLLDVNGAGRFKGTVTGFNFTQTTVSPNSLLKTLISQNDAESSSNGTLTIRASATPPTDLMQWQSSSSAVYGVINSVGNVGIGSSSPTARLDLGTAASPLTIPALKSTTGTRYLCIDTTGVVTSSASACSGT